MSRKTIAILLKALVVCTALGTLFGIGVLLPHYLRHVVEVRPELHAWFGISMAYFCALAVPVGWALALAWQVFTTIGNDTTFCPENAKRLKTASLLAVIDTGVVVLIAVGLFFAGALPPFLFFTFGMLAFVGFALAIVCFALGVLVGQASSIKQENDLTV